MEKKSPKKLPKLQNFAQSGNTVNSTYVQSSFSHSVGKVFFEDWHEIQSLLTLIKEMCGTFFRYALEKFGFCGFSFS